MNRWYGCRVLPCGGGGAVRLPPTAVSSFVFALRGDIVELDGLDGQFIGVFSGFEIQSGPAASNLGGAFDRLVQIELGLFEIEFHSTLISFEFLEFSRRHRGRFAGFFAINLAFGGHEIDFREIAVHLRTVDW